MTNKILSDEEVKKLEKGHYIAHEEGLFANEPCDICNLITTIKAKDKEIEGLAIKNKGVNRDLFVTNEKLRKEVVELGHKLRQLIAPHTINESFKVIRLKNRQIERLKKKIKEDKA